MNRRPFRQATLAITCCLIFHTTSYGQLRTDDRVPAEKKAIAAVNVDVQSLYKNKLVKMLVDLAMDEAGDEFPFEVGDFTKISAFVAAPKGLDPDSLASINFYVYVGFKDSEVSSKLRQLMMSTGGKEVTIGGKKMIAPPEDSGFFVDLQSKYMVAGTEEYLTSPSNQFATKGLAETYSALPNAPIRVAIDMDGARGLLDKVSAMAKENADFLTKPYVSLIDEVSSLTITSDLDKGSILKITVNGHDEAEGKKIKQKIDALLGLGKEMTESIPAGSAETFLMSAAKDVEAAQNGKSVVVDLKKPAGFEESVIKMMGAARQAATTARDMNNVRQVLLAMHNYHDVHEQFPFAKNVEGEDNDNGLSWAVYLLPYMEEAALHDSFDLNADYKSPKNAKLGMIVVDSLRLQSGQIKWVRPKKVANRLAAIRDGTSNTVAFVQSRKVDMAPWIKPGSIKPAEVMEEFKALKDGQIMIFGMYDGSIRRVTNKDDAVDIEAMLEPADGKAPQR